MRSPNYAEWTARQVMIDQVDLPLNRGNRTTLSALSPHQETHLDPWKSNPRRSPSGRPSYGGHRDGPWSVSPDPLIRSA
jgi:hypothetical protein